jgi:hypothetical protein
MGMNPKRVLLVSPNSIYGQNLSLIGDEQLERFPC